MPYIIIDLQGPVNDPGYLKVDRSKQFVLSDGMMLAVSVGTHHLRFSTHRHAHSGLAHLHNERDTAMANDDDLDDVITADFSKNSVMHFTVTYDGYGHILDTPTFSMETVSDEQYQSLSEQYNIQTHEPLSPTDEKSKTLGTELLLCLFLGMLGAHRFYRGRIGLGIFYLLTLGVFGLGWFLDTVELWFRWIKSK